MAVDMLGKARIALVVYQNMGDLPRRAVSRLTNAANEQIDSLDALPDLERKLAQRTR